MQGKVTVVADKFGNVYNMSGNPDFAYLRVKQTVAMYDETGWFNQKELTALIHGKLEDLMSMKYTAGQELPGNIIIKEQHSPFDAKNGDRHLKIAGDSGIICRVDDEPIYRKTVYTERADAEHTLIQHTNGDEIRAAIREIRDHERSESYKAVPSDFLSSVTL